MNNTFPNININNIIVTKKRKFKKDKKDKKDKNIVKENIIQYKNDKIILNGRIIGLLGLLILLLYRVKKLY